MSRRSPRKKAISPVTVIESEDEEFVGVASDDHISEDVDDHQHTDEDESKSLKGSSNHGKNLKIGKHSVSFRKNSAPSLPVQTEDDETIEITPPPTPSPVKAAGGKKRVISNNESDDDDVFVPSPTRDSPKKARAKEPLTPSKITKSARQLIFDTAVSDVGKASASPSSLPFLKGDKGKAVALSRSPSKAVSPELGDSTVYLADVEMRRVFVPELDRCQIYEKSLVDPLLKQTYRKIPRLPRMADYAPAWGLRSDDGGFQLSEVLPYYESPDIEYLKRLVTFSHDKAGNVANLSRIDPSLLGVKDASSFTKNALYLHGILSAPLLCFSLILVTRDNHEHGRVFGSDPKEWVMKDIAGVLLAMELERFIAVLGLAYELPYVPDDSARREGDLLYLTMTGNAFSFTTTMMHKSEFDSARVGSSSKSTPKGVKKHKIFAPASPAFSSRTAALSSAARKASLRASETVPVYDGRKRQLQVPGEISRIPDILPRYVGSIPEFSLALVAYTVSTYSAASGARKNQVTANLHIHFGVVLHEPSTDEGSGNEEKDTSI